YLFRNVNPKYLVSIVVLMAMIDFGSGTVLYQYARNKRIDYVEAKQAEAEGKTLTAEQDKAISDWRDLEKSFIPNREDAKEITRKMKTDYVSVASYVRPLAFKLQTFLLPLEVWD